MPGMNFEKEKMEVNYMSSVSLLTLLRLDCALAGLVLPLVVALCGKTSAGGSKEDLLVPSLTAAFELVSLISSTLWCRSIPTA